MIQLCRIDLHLTLAILPNQMDVWQPEHTLEIQACKRASENTHRFAHPDAHMHTHTLVKVTMLHETKGQMVDNDIVPALARWLKYAFPFGCAHKCVPMQLSDVVFTWGMS